MKNTSPYQIIKDPETFFPIVTKYFQEKGVIKYLQTKYLVEVARAVQNSKKRELNPMRAKLVKKGVSSEFAMQFVLHYLQKKKFNLTLECGETELPNFFTIYKTTTTISSKLKLNQPPSEWLTEVLIDHKDNKLKNLINKQKNDRSNSNMQNDDFISDNSFDEDKNNKTNTNVTIIEEEEEYYSDDAINIIPFPNRKPSNRSNLNISKNAKLLMNELNSDSNSS